MFVICLSVSNEYIIYAECCFMSVQCLNELHCVSKIKKQTLIHINYFHEYFYVQYFKFKFYIVSFPNVPSSGL